MASQPAERRSPRTAPTCSSPSAPRPHRSTIGSARVEREEPGDCGDLRDGERKPVESEQESDRCAYGDERDDRRKHTGREAASHLPSMLTGATCGHCQSIGGKGGSLDGPRGSLAGCLAKCSRVADAPDHGRQATPRYPRGTAHCRTVLVGAAGYRRRILPSRRHFRFAAGLVAPRRTAMVRKGSTVRVRQRALEEDAAWAPCRATASVSVCLIDATMNQSIGWSPR